MDSVQPNEAGATSPTRTPRPKNDNRILDANAPARTELNSDRDRLNAIHTNMRQREMYGELLDPKTSKSMAKKDIKNFNAIVDAETKGVASKWVLDDLQRHTAYKNALLKENASIETELRKHLPVEKAAPSPTTAATSQSPTLKQSDLDLHFEKKGSKYHFRENSDVVAFQERKYMRTPALSTNHNANELVVRAMVDVSMNKDWKEIELRGTQEFRRLAWVEANARGLAVKGYEPSLDDVQASKRRAEALSRNDKEVSPAATQAKPQKTERNDVKVDPAKVVSRAEIAGQVVELGTAPYKHRRGESPSYYVSLREQDGSLTTVWGKDLERAAKAIDLKVGDTVTSINKTGNKPVTVQAKVRNDKGDIVATEPREATLNQWEIKKAVKEQTKPLSPQQQAVVDAATQRAPEEVKRQVRDVATERIIEMAHNGKVPAVWVYDNKAPSVAPHVPREPVQPNKTPARTISR